jgi:hypothetical protein
MLPDDISLAHVGPALDKRRCSKRFGDVSAAIFSEIVVEATFLSISPSRCRHVVYWRNEPI